MLTITKEQEELETSEGDKKVVASIEFNGYKYELIRSQVDTIENIRRRAEQEFPQLVDNDNVPVRGVSLKVFLRELEREILRVSLVAMNWNKLQTAKCVGLHRTALIEKLRARGLHPTTEHILKTQGVRER